MTTHTLEIVISDTAHLLEYQIQRSHKARYIRISLQPHSITNHKLKVTAPACAPLNTITDFITQKKSWITKHLFLAPKIKPIIEFPLGWPEKIISDACLPFQGNRYNIKLVVSTSHWLTPSILLNTPEFIIHDTPDIIPNLISWYQTEARKMIDQAINHYCPILDLWPKNITLKQQKSRWGSCGIHNDIHINWLLVIAPAIVLEYVVVHELAHLKYRSHGPRFWGLVEKLLPNFNTAEGWLKQYGRHLKPPGWTTQ